MKKVFSVFLASTVVVLGCSLFVTRNLDEVMQTSGEFAVHSVNKNDDVVNFDSLLSGEVNLFVEFGADTCIVAEYFRSREKYTVEFVSFDNQKGALGAYFITDIPGSTPVKMGYYARESADIVQCVKGNYIFSVLPSSGGDITGAHDLAGVLAGRIRGSRIKPDIYEGLPQSGLMEQTGLYFMGPDVFQKRFPSRLADVLKLEDSREGLAAQYQTDNKVVELIKIRYQNREKTLEVVNAYLKSRSDYPIILPLESLQFYTIVEPDRSAVYIAEYSDVLYLMLGGSHGGKSQEFFEFILRGGK